MSSMNKVFILGRLGKDPEVRFTSDGKQVTTFSVATSTVSKDAAGSKVEHTEWHRLVAFNKAAEVAGKYLKKGGMVLVEGSLRTNKWDDNGVTRYGTDIVVGRLTLLGGKQSETQQEAPAESFSSGIEDDIPF